MDELCSNIRPINARAARVVTPTLNIRIRARGNIIAPTTPLRSAVTKTKKFLYLFRRFLPPFLFFKKEKIFLFCLSVRTSQSWRSRKNEVVLMSILSIDINKEFFNVPSAFASGITAKATRALILGMCDVCFANRTPLYGERKESSPQLRDSSSQL